MNADAERRFSPRVIVAVVLVGIFSLAGLSVLSAYAPDLRKGDNGGAHAMSRSAVGFAAAARLLNATGEYAELSRASMGDDPESLLILTPQPMQGADAVAEVTHSGPRLIVLPKWAGSPHRTRPGWIRDASLTPVAIAGAAVPRPELERTGDAEKDTAARRSQVQVARRTTTGPVRLTLQDGTPFGVTGPVRQLQTISGPGLIPVLVDETGAAVVAQDRESQAYVLADPDLMNNQGLKSPETARIASRLPRLIWSGEGVIAFDVTLHGFGKPRSVLRSMLEPPLLGASLCLLLATGLVAFQAFVRFGPSRRQDRALALGKRALADNTAGLVRLARREHRMAGPYARLVRASTARALAAPRDLSDAELDALLDRLGRQAGVHQAYTALAAEAAAAKSPADLLRVARNLHRWKLEMTRGRQ